MSATIHHLAPHLYLIVLSPPIRGFQNFIGAWLVDGPDAVYLVDVGPAATAGQLFEALERLGIDHLDYVCLTHIHMDHAGAAGHLADHFSGARVVCHPKGVPHIIDPEQLWQGTLKTLGDTGRAYGRMLPVKSARIATDRDLASAPFRLLDTPGHSPHHYAIAAGDFLFAGEAGGVCLSLPSGARYLRPATPPRFFMQTSLSSIDRLIDAGAATMCYGHLGMHADGRNLLKRHRQQLHFWKETLSMQAVAGRQTSDLVANQWVDMMLEKDTNLKGLNQFPPEVQVRERGFLLNSIKGFIGYLAGDH